MKKGLVKLLVLLMTFLMGIIGFSQLNNQKNEDLTTEMADATLPIVSFGIKTNGEYFSFNELHGYTKEMNALYMRDTITPVPMDWRLGLLIEKSDLPIDQISYEIRSLDTSRLIADTKVEDYAKKKASIEAELVIENLLEVNVEYLMILKLKSGQDTIYYYTRIMKEAEEYAMPCMEFALDFHEKALDEEKYQELALYLEPNASADNTTLNRVDIHSSLKQVAWADFDGERLTTPVPSLKEITDSYAVVTLSYMMEAVGEKGEMEYYNSEEIFRVRYTKDRTYLLNYDRNMNQIFRSASAFLYENYIQLGIRDEVVEYAYNEKGDIAAFVQEGELWCFNETTNHLVQVFSFIGNEEIDKRENYKEHDIKIVNIDETGSINFVVYGYMNAGNHEGQVGICAYHYDSVANTIEEELFVPSLESYQVMKANLGQLMYENTQGIFFFMEEGCVYRVDLSDMKQKILISDLDANSYSISDSHKSFAWIDEENSSSIQIMNLDTEQKQQITVGEDEWVRPLGYMGEDFIYGVAKRSDITQDAVGNVTFPMYKVCIVDSVTLEVLKEYQKEGYYTVSVEKKDYVMYLNRVRLSETGYVEATTDTIMNREGEGDEKVSVHETVTQAKQTQYQLALVDMVKEASPKVLTPKEVVFTNDRQVTLQEKEEEFQYYAYAKGRVVCVTNRLQQAIGAANEQMGVVIGYKQQYIWQRARKIQQPAIGISVGEEDAQGNSIAKSVSGILEKESININVGALLEQGKTPKEILESTMRDAMILDLRGCKLEEVLYYVSLGNPVFAMKNDMEAVLLTGYDTNSITYFDASQNQDKKVSLEEAAALFDSAGNAFLGYLK